MSGRGRLSRASKFTVVCCLVAALTPLGTGTAQAANCSGLGGGLQYKNTTAGAAPGQGVLYGVQGTFRVRSLVRPCTGSSTGISFGLYSSEPGNNSYQEIGYESGGTYNRRLYVSYQHGNNLAPVFASFGSAGGEGDLVGGGALFDGTFKFTRFYWNGAAIASTGTYGNPNPTQYFGTPSAYSRFVTEVGFANGGLHGTNTTEASLGDQSYQYDTAGNAATFQNSPAGSFLAGGTINGQWRSHNYSRLLQSFYYQ